LRAVTCGRAKHGQTWFLALLSFFLLSQSSFRPLPSFFSLHLPTAALAMATAEVQEIRATSYVGFDSITQQIEHKLLKRGFQFNVIVVGASILISQTCWNLLKQNIFYFNGVLVIRSDRFGKVDPHQHYICFTPHRLEG
jgi:hypothetical protein